MAFNKTRDRVMNIILCTRHGKVYGPICQACRAEKYNERVKEGKITQRMHKEVLTVDSKITPLQIRYRAFIERNKREDAKLGKDAYPWQRQPRTPREFSSIVFFRKKDYD